LLFHSSYPLNHVPLMFLSTSLPALLFCLLFYLFCFSTLSTFHCFFPFSALFLLFSSFLSEFFIYLRFEDALRFDLVCFPHCCLVLGMYPFVSCFFLICTSLAFICLVLISHFSWCFSPYFWGVSLMFLFSYRMCIILFPF